jgi:hypothetical protein
MVKSRFIVTNLPLRMPLLFASFKTFATLGCYIPLPGNDGNSHFGEMTRIIKSCNAESLPIID